MTTEERTNAKVTPLNQLLVGLGSSAHKLVLHLKNHHLKNTIPICPPKVESEELSVEYAPT
ncbi:hypothetical protein A2U01_0077580, partial [Trifolium medium]|nr:hypothetical protein [Trifolium medium]